MANKTIKPHGNTFSGSIASGMGSIFSPNGRKYYILEHKVSSKYHKAGEAQEIIVDTIEMGRDSRCQVRFDERFETVSRRHAAIVREGDMWKLVQLSSTNKTFLNGKPIDKEWFLQNGDEIQLSVNGPKVGFIIPTGNKATVGSIGLTRRLSLFRQQAMRPYKAAIASLCVLIVLLSGVGGYFLYKQQSLLDYNETMIAKLIKDAVTADSVYQKKLEILEKKKQKVIVRHIGSSQATDPVLSKAIAEVKPYVYYITTVFYIEVNGTKHKISTSQGTGFLLSDGKFVTARHCVQPWLYYDEELIQYNAMLTTISKQGRDDIKGYAVINAQSMNDHFTLRSHDFVINASYDKVFRTEKDGKDVLITTASPIIFRNGTQLGSERMYGNDWAYANVNKTGGIKANINMSASLKTGATVHVLGFPSGLGKADGEQEVEPIYNKMSVARDGLNNSGCIMVSEGVAHGNSGGPVFILNKGKLEAIAIVSRKESATQQYGMFGIEQQQQQYDHLVPLANMK